MQVFGDTAGNVVHLFERDCTLQRRNQKVIEEAPAPGMSEALRAKMCDAAVKLAKSVNYEGAGTVEFLVEGGALSADAKWYFIEMNTRLQVEHPVTEEITGLDLVEWQIRVAAGEPLPLTQADITMSGHAIEVRLCAEDPANGFMPSIGRIAILDARSLKGDTRLETGVRAGDSVSPFYDSMIAKLIEHGVDRRSAIKQLVHELDTFPIAGVRTNVGFLVNLLRHPGVTDGKMDTGLIARDLTSLSDQRVSRGLLVIACQHAIYLAAEDAARLNRTDAHDNDPWQTNDAFQLGGQLGGQTERRMVLLVDGQPHTVRVRWGGTDTWAHVTVDDADHFLDEHVERYSKRDDNSTVYAIERGRQLVVSRPTYDAADIDDDKGGGKGGAIRAPINGRVAKIFVAAGETVEKGARIAVVEAMKMEHVLTAAITGTVDKVAAQEGAQVTQGTLIATIAES